jgi:hypothetical protein
MAIDSSSSYAKAVDSATIKREIAATVAPFEQRFRTLGAPWKDRKALGALVAVHGRIVRADVFASPVLFDKYWPKLVRSYAAEAMSESRRFEAFVLISLLSGNGYTVHLTKMASDETVWPEKRTTDRLQRPVA